MDVGWTFGSVGDIIAVCQLAVRLGQALGAGHGSSTREYKDIRKELDNFVHILTLLRETPQSPCLSVRAIQDRIRSVIDECCSLMQEIEDHIIPKYGESLGSRSSSRPIKDAVKKVSFPLREGDRLRVFRERLAAQVANLTLLMGAATLGSSQANTHQLGTAIQLFTRFYDHTQHQLANTQTLLQQQASDVKAISQKSHEHERLLIAITKSVATISKIATQAKSLSTQILGNIMQVFQQASAEPVIQRSLDPTRELPVILEDSIGSCRPIPMEWVTDWERLFGLLAVDFIGHKGHGMVLRREFALEEHISGKDLDQDLPLTACLRRGMKINMSMVFSDQKIVSTSCPRCSTHTDAPEGDLVQCPKDFCGMFFRIVSPTHTEIDRAVTEDLTLEDDMMTLAPNPADFQRVRLVLSNVIEDVVGFQGPSTGSKEAKAEPIIEDGVHKLLDPFAQLPISDIKGSRGQIPAESERGPTTSPPSTKLHQQTTIKSTQSTFSHHSGSSRGSSFRDSASSWSVGKYRFGVSPYSSGYTTQVKEIRNSKGHDIVLICHNRNSSSRPVSTNGSAA